MIVRGKEISAKMNVRVKLLEGEPVVPGRERSYIMIKPDGV